MVANVFHLTKEKLRELKKEYKELVALERRKVMNKEAPKVLESEDLNPEFVSFQEDMEFLRYRIREVKYVLEHYEIIKKPKKENQDTVNLGAKVRVEVAGEQDEFIIVGTLEANPNLGKISILSPVGKALLGRKVGDEVNISSPIKTIYKIKSVKYEIS